MKLAASQAGEWLDSNEDALMIFYTGRGAFALAIFIAPFIVIASILNYGFGFDVLATKSWWPLHSLMLMGAILTFVVGWYWNREMVEDTIRERSGLVKVLRPRHTLYWIRMEYWGLIFLAVYFAFSLYRSYRFK
jgi:hypothetical protein